MHSRKTVPIPDLMSVANMELIRLDFKSSTLSRHSKEFRSFSNYCRENEITAYDAETGPQYFQHCYGLDIGNSTAKLTKQQLDTRCSIRFLDDIFQFGYALRYSHHDYTVPRQYVDLLEEYLAWCHRNNSSDGTIRVKRTKIRQFFCFLDGRGIELSDLTAAEISDFMTTLCRYHRATIHVFSSVYVISSAISMKMGYWTMTYLQVFQGQRSTLKKISPKRGPQRKYDNYCPLLTAAMRLEKEITRCSCLLFCWA